MGDSITVIIPTWNRSSTLEQAIRSALSQTYPPLEVLVCDDGSTDNTEQVVRLINDPRVIWLPGERSGRPAVPRNRGIRNSRGSWIAFLDDDDVWFSEKLEIQMAKVQSSGCMASCTDAVRFLPDEGGQGCLLGLEVDVLGFKDLIAGNRVVCSSAMIHRSLLNRVEGFPEAAGLKSIEDYAFWLRIATVTDFAFSGAQLVTYTDSPHTSIRSACTDEYLQRRLVIRNFLAWGCRKHIMTDYLRSALYSYGESLLFSAKRQLTGCRERLSGITGHK